ncbi:MAG: dihydroorotate dehydrogenase electron transfer subunit [Defluviitaleaceae bacterium]|nr:dihydroorotate dehydrogenase electron transfer subunit [Defluviitaleaceae bacterium]MCL2262596.1 dihydroorotate dehydrogenase electron transfer subunit [Defluviitaleaceae bacterium]
MTEKVFQHAKILSNAQIAPQIFSMTLHAPEIADTARAGQFVMVYLDRGEMLLPRPISLCDAGLHSGEIHIVYQVVGAGTAVMSEMTAGEGLQILGALGNGFQTDDITEQRQRAVLVGGGIGAPPLYFLAKQLKARGVSTDIYLGFRDEPILTDMFRTVADRLFIATESGNFGHKGLITEVLVANMNDSVLGVYSCGPKPLLRAVAEFSQAAKVPCQVCMEARMACGIGTCVGCVVKVGESYARVCTEGPVFYGNEVNWNE